MNDNITYNYQFNITNNIITNNINVSILIKEIQGFPSELSVLQQAVNSLLEVVQKYTEHGKEKVKSDLIPDNIDNSTADILHTPLFSNVTVEA